MFERVRYCQLWRTPSPLAIFHETYIHVILLELKVEKTSRKRYRDIVVYVIMQRLYLFIQNLNRDVNIIKLCKNQ